MLKLPNTNPRFTTVIILQPLTSVHPPNHRRNESWFERSRSKAQPIYEYTLWLAFIKHRHAIAVHARYGIDSVKRRRIFDVNKQSRCSVRVGQCIKAMWLDLCRRMRR